MKIYNFNPPNPFMKKTYQVEKTSSSTSTVHVKSAFLGAWSFPLSEIDHKTLCNKINRYCNESIMLQDLFSEMSPNQRESFLTKPTMHDVFEED
jgi:hypothetical protein